MTRLNQLTTLKVAQMNQRRLVEAPEVLASIDAMMALIKQQSRTLEDAIAALIKADPLWETLDRAFRHIKGVAGRTVARLLASVPPPATPSSCARRGPWLAPPEIGTLSGKAIAKLIGLAPIARDSGTSIGKRIIRGGRADVRSILVLIARVVRRHDPDFAHMHKRLTKAGKPLMVANVALARKLLVRLNAKARDARTALNANTLTLVQA